MVTGYGLNSVGYTTTLPTGNYRTTRYLTNNNVRNWRENGGGYNTYLNITERCVSSNNVWTNYKCDWVFTGYAIMPAEIANEFCYNAYLPSMDTVYRLLYIQDVGWNYSASHTLRDDVPWCGALTAYVPNVVSYFRAARHSNWQTNDYFSYLPAKQVRYKTKIGDIHFMDEGFYMLKVDQNCSLKFDILFRPNSGANTTTTVSFAKAPFNNQFNNNDLLRAKVGSGTATTTNSIATGTKVTVEIADLQKDTPIYLKWTYTSTDINSQVGLYSLDNILMITE